MLNFSVLNFKDKPFLVQGTVGAEIIDELSPFPSEYVVNKKRFSSFFQTDLLMILMRFQVSSSSCLWSTNSKLHPGNSHRCYRLWLSCNSVGRCDSCFNVGSSSGKSFRYEKYGCSYSDHRRFFYVFFFCRFRKGCKIFRFSGIFKRCWLGNGNIYDVAFVNDKYTFSLFGSTKGM